MRFSRTISIGLIVLTGAAMLWVSWGFWADPIFASGRELYVPWQIARGKILYRDIAHLNGPFSVYFNAAIFRIFSPRVHVLVLSNLIWLTALVAMIWRLWRMIAGLFAASVACMLLLTLFAFVQLGGAGGFNFVLPYEHEVTHGMILSFAAIFFLAEYARRPIDHAGWLCAAGSALGLVSLTRASMFFAGVIPITCGVIASIYAHRLPRRQVISHVALFIGSVLIMPLLAFGWLCSALPADRAWAAITRSWRWALDEQTLMMEHTQVWLGISKTSANSDRILLSCFAYALIILPALALGKSLRKKGEARIVAVIVTIAVTLSVLYIFYDRIIWQYDATAGLTLIIFGIAIALMTVLLQRQRDRIDAVLIVRLTIIWFALLLLIQLGLRPVIFQYGFAFALPAMLIGSAALVSWLPALADRAGGTGCVPRAAALCALGVLVFNHLSFYRRVIPHPPAVLGEGIDALRFDRRGVVLRDVLDTIATRGNPRDTLLALPDGAMLNFLSGRENPTPYTSLMPIEMLDAGEDRVLESIEKSPPDWIVINTLSTAAFGTKSFTEGYGHEIWRWIEQRYERVAEFGNQSFSMRVYHRKESATREAN